MPITFSRAKRKKSSQVSRRRWNEDRARHPGLIPSANVMRLQNDVPGGHPHRVTGEC